MIDQLCSTSLSQTQTRVIDSSPRHAAEEVVLGRGVVGVLDGPPPFGPRFGGSPLAVSPHTCRAVHDEKGIAVTTAATRCHLGRRARASCTCSHRGVSGCGSGPEARVCPPRWIEEPAARAGSTPSLVGSEGERSDIMGPFLDPAVSPCFWHLC